MCKFPKLHYLYLSLLSIPEAKHYPITSDRIEILKSLCVNYDSASKHPRINSLILVQLGTT